MDEIGLDAASMALDEFLLARIAEDKRVATDAAGAAGRAQWSTDVVGDGPAGPRTAEHVIRHDPARVLAECSAKRRIVLACREARPETAFVGTHPPGMADFPPTVHGQHQLAALMLAFLALPYSRAPALPTGMAAVNPPAAAGSRHEGTPRARVSSRTVRGSSSRFP